MTVSQLNFITTTQFHNHNPVSQPQPSFTTTTQFHNQEKQLENWQGGDGVSVCTIPSIEVSDRLLQQVSNRSVKKFLAAFDKS
ncbi:MAG: hypothetical protein MUF72_00380 [Elainella sp. Prado103]|nr:hypothetical protein [Elainella sp. Prado103]